MGVAPRFNVALYELFRLGNLAENRVVPTKRKSAPFAKAAKDAVPSDDFTQAMLLACCAVSPRSASTAMGSPPADKKGTNVRRFSVAPIAKDPVDPFSNFENDAD